MAKLSSSDVVQEKTMRQQSWTSADSDVGQGFSQTVILGAAHFRFIRMNTECGSDFFYEYLKK